MMLLGLLVIFSFGISGVPAPEHGGHASKFCYSCHKVSASHACTHVERCGPEEACRVEVVQQHGSLHFTYGCAGHHECEGPALVGKRAVHDHTKCRECCTHDRCNKHLCGAFFSSGLTTSASTVQHTQAQSTMAPTTQAPVISTTTDAPPAHISVVVTQAPTTAMPIFIATDIITQPPSTAAPAPACVDIEEDGFKCSAFDQFNFCTDPDSFAYSLAQEHCRAHCGICNGTHTATDTPPHASTGGVITAMPVGTDTPAHVNTGGVITARPVVTDATASVIPGSGVITAKPVASFTTTTDGNTAIPFDVHSTTQQRWSTSA